MGKFVWLLVLPLIYIIVDSTQGLFSEPLTLEDGPVETVGALFLLLAAVFFFIAYLRSNSFDNRFFGKAINRNVYFLLLTLLFFFGFGEEISWGQRIFNWETPDALVSANAQQETNLHNLWLFQAYDKQGDSKGFLALLINPSRLFSLFWLLFCVMGPLIYRFSDVGKNLYRYFGVPKVELWVGALFLFNFVFYKLYEGNISDYPYLDELKESVYSALFCFVAYRFVTRARQGDASG